MKVKKNKIKLNFSKLNQKINLYFFISSCFFLTSCLFFQNPIGKTPEEISKNCSIGNARFIANQISTIPNHEPITINDTEGLADSFTLNLKTCLKDAFYTDNSILPGASFVIEYESNLENKKEQVEVTSDLEGCIQWHEDYKYKYTLKSNWLGLKRVIRQPKGGPYPGAVEIEIAINPWLSPFEKDRGLPQVLDMRCEYVNKSIFKSKSNRKYHKKGLEFLKTADKEKPLLWAPNFSLQVIEVSNKDKKKSSAVLTTTNEIKQFLLKFQQPCKSRTDANEDCYKRYFKFDFRIPLEFRSLSSSGSFDTKLKGGEYKIESLLKLIPNQEDNKNYKLSNCEHKAIKLNEIDKSLSFSCNFDISFFDQNSIFKILHRISSVNSNNPKAENYLPVRPFEGQYTVEFDFGSLLKKVQIDANDNNIYSEVLRKPEKNLGLFSKINDDINADIIFAKKTGKAESVNLKVLQLGAKGDYKYSDIYEEDVIKREINFVGKVCVNDALKSQQIANTKFRVFLQEPRKKIKPFVDDTDALDNLPRNENTKENEDTTKNINKLIPGDIKEVFFNPETKEKFETDSERCLTIPIRIPHKVYNKQKYFEIIAHVVSEELNLYGRVKLALNPWQRAFQAFQDAQNLDEKHIRFDTKKIDPPELVINQFRSINLFPSYGIDKLLNIHIFHRFYLFFQPFIRRPDNVSLGLNHMSRELLRDGYYLVRVLIVRNLKETGDEQAVQNQENLNDEQSKVNSKEMIDLKKADYLTHTDSVVRIKANFVNFYMPVYLSTKQMYYIASRNLIVIQIYPADPELIHYKEDGSIDNKKTKWKAFVDHDLENQPYAGAINIQNWRNWNLLQPALIDTDKIIELSPTGKKYKHFDFSENKESDSSNNKESGSSNDKESGSSNDNKYISVSEDCKQTLRPLLASTDYTVTIEELEKVEQEFIALQNMNTEDTEDTEDSVSQYQKKQEYQKKQSELKDRRDQIDNTIESILGVEGEVFNQKFSEEDLDRMKETCSEKELKQYSHALDMLKKDTESKYSPDLLSDFSLEYALKSVVLGTDTTHTFIDDLKSSYDDYLEWYKRSFYSDVDTFKNEDPLFLMHKQMFMHVVSNTKYSLTKKHLISLKGIKGKKGKEVRLIHLIEAYLFMLKKYSENHNFLDVIYSVVKGDKYAFGELFCPENSSCKEIEFENCSQECAKEKLDFLIRSNLFEKLEFSDDMTIHSFIKKQAVIFMILFLFPEDMLDFLDDSLNPYFNLKPKPLLFNKNNNDYLDKIKELLQSNQEDIIQRSDLTINPLSISIQARQKLDKITQANHLNALVNKRHFNWNFNWNEDSLKALVDQGVKKEDINTFENQSFFKSLCFFWFKDFIKNYLDPKLKISTYTNYVRNFNYLQILEHAYVRNQTNVESFNSDLQEARNTIESDQVMGYKEKMCHIEYRQCVSEDFCFSYPVKNISNTDVKAKYCEAYSIDQKSCRNRVEDICSNPNNVNLSLCVNPEDRVEDICPKQDNKNLSLCKDESKVDPKDRIQDICSKQGNKNLSFCKYKYKSKVNLNTCYQDLKYFCRLNPDHGFCDDFENRCFKTYSECLMDTNLFQEKIDPFLNSIINDFNPAIETCVKDFREFFKVENKMIVYDISTEDNELKYKGGFLRAASFSLNTSVGSYMNWTANRGQSISFSWDITKILPKIATLGLSKNISQTQSDNESNSGRIAFDGRFGESIFLSVGKAEIEIGVKEFQKCVIIKPRPNAFIASFQGGAPKYYDNLWSNEARDFDKIVFSRSGLILCNPVERKGPSEELERITESYYYISQSSTDPTNSQFLDLYDLANRPFILVLRGQREYLKFYHMARKINGEGKTINEQPSNFFLEHVDITEYARGLSLKLRESTQTGFYPGIYDYPWDTNEEVDADPFKYIKEDYILRTVHPMKIFEVPNTAKDTLPFNK